MACDSRIYFLIAVLSHGSDITHALLKGGADVDAKNARDQTALMFAAEKGHSVLVQALLDRGADLNVKD